MKNILMTIKDYESTTITSPIVKKTIELVSNCSSKVRIVHIVPASQQPPYNVNSELFRNAIATELRHEHQYLQHLAKCMRDENVDAQALLLQGSVINTILHESERLDIDLVVVGRQKHHLLYNTLMSGTEEGLLAKSACPIMFVPI